MPPIRSVAEHHPISTAIKDGDRAAATGEWMRAMELWEPELESLQQQAATERIRWLLATQGEGSAGPPRRSVAGGPRIHMLAAGAACALVGTLSVFLGQHQVGVARNVLAAIAWAVYIAAAVLVVAHAFGRHPGNTAGPGPSKGPRLSDAELRDARRLAAHLSPGIGPGDSSA